MFVRISGTMAYLSSTRIIINSPRSYGTPNRYSHTVELCNACYLECTYDRKWKYRSIVVTRR